MRIASRYSNMYQCVMPNASMINMKNWVGQNIYVLCTNMIAFPKILHLYTRDIHVQLTCEDRRPVKEEQNYLGIIDINYYGNGN